MLQEAPSTGAPLTRPRGLRVGGQPVSKRPNYLDRTDLENYYNQHAVPDIEDRTGVSVAVDGEELGDVSGVELVAGENVSITVRRKKNKRRRRRKKPVAELTIDAAAGGTGTTDIFSTTWTVDWDGSVDDPDIGNGTKSGKNLQIFYNADSFLPDFVHGQVYIVFGDETTFGTGDWDFSLPFGPADNATNDGEVVGHGGYYAGGNFAPVSVVMNGTSEVRLVKADGSVVGSATETWAAGDVLTFFFTEWIE